MINKILDKYRKKENKDGTLNYDSIQKMLYSNENIDCKLESYKDFEKILNSLDEDQGIAFRIEDVNDGSEEGDIRDFKGLGPRFVSNIAYRNLKPETKEEYFNANYRVSQKKKHYNHSMEIEAGKKETLVKSISKKKRATLEWKVSK